MSKGEVQSFPKGTSCGRDGLRAQHILDALCGEGSTIAVGLLKAISMVVNLLLEGRCPKVLAEFVASAPLTPLLKPDNGIRPIAVGAIWRRLASKVAMRGVRKEMSKDHWGLSRIAGHCFSMLWYFDDGTINGDTISSCESHSIIRAKGHRLGLELNLKKTESFLAFSNGGEGEEGCFLPPPRDIWENPTVGCQTPGRRGQYLEFCRPTFLRDVANHDVGSGGYRTILNTGYDPTLSVDEPAAFCRKKGEAPVNFLTDPLEGRSTLRPADILVFGWAGGKHACVDLTGVSPLVGLRDNGFVAGQAALKAESSKVAKHEKACLENQHVFIPFAFDTFDFLAPEAEEFLNRVQRVVQSNFSTPKTQNFIFSRIGFAIQKGVAAQLVARLPAILL
ncbi:hypothetical protein Tco_0044345 [Tanacetum coccineum]